MAGKRRYYVFILHRALALSAPAEVWSVHKHQGYYCLLLTLREFSILRNAILPGRGLQAQMVADLLLKYTREEIESKRKREVVDAIKDMKIEDKSAKSRAKDQGKHGDDDQALEKIDTLIILDRNLDLVLAQLLSKHAGANLFLFVRFHRW